MKLHSFDMTDYKILYVALSQHISEKYTKLDEDYVIMVQLLQKIGDNELELEQDFLKRDNKQEE